MTFDYRVLSVRQRENLQIWAANIDNEKDPFTYGNVLLLWNHIYALEHKLDEAQTVLKHVGQVYPWYCQKHTTEESIAQHLVDIAQEAYWRTK